jgi:metal-responsive CopG/Arc/MetJ family transcriptional regulator
MTEFDPSKTEKTVITLRLETELLQEVDKLSGKIDISRNEFIIKCIKYAMENRRK